MDLDLLEKKLNKTREKTWKVTKTLGVALKSLAVSMVEYGFLAWIMFYIWDHFGWERTALVLACGVILFGLKQRRSDDFQQYQIRELSRKIEELSKNGRA